MTAIACIINPLNSSQLMVFGYSNSELVVFERDASEIGPVGPPESKHPNKGTTSNAPKPGDGILGAITNPSQFTVFLYNSWISLYGINSSNSLALFSPGLSLLGPTASTTIAWLAGCSDGGTNAWLYYWQDVTGTGLSASTPTLYEYNITNQVPMPMSSTDSMAATSTITAAYDPKQGHRYYIYQITSGSINSLEIIMRVDDGPDIKTQLLPYIDDLALSKPISACCNPDGSGMVIYYITMVGTTLGLRRVWWKSYQSFQESTPVSLQAAMDATSGLFVTADDTAAHICYNSQYAGKSGIYHWRETWADISKN